MSTATDQLTITLVHSVGGLLADVEGLPLQVGAPWVRQARLEELAVAAVKARYPELVPVTTSYEAEDRVWVYLERV